MSLRPAIDNLKTRSQVEREMSGLKTELKHLRTAVVGNTLHGAGKERQNINNLCPVIVGSEEGMRGREGPRHRPFFPGWEGAALMLLAGGLRG